MTAKPKSELMAKMRAERAAGGLKRFEVWLPETQSNSTSKALKALALMDADSISALLSDNQCSLKAGGCGEYAPFCEQNRDLCVDCFDRLHG